MAEPLLRFESDAGVAVLTFNDPERLNAMTEAMGQAIAERMAALAEDEAVRAVVLTGAGRAFSAGGDLEMLERMAADGAADPGGPTRERHRAFMRRFYGLYLSVRDLPQPTVAAVNGPAIGAGLCVALACDLRIAAREAKLGLNFVRLGIHPGMAATWTLPRLVGPAHAADLLYTGRILEGAEAERIGLVNRAVAREALLPDALALARSIAEGAPLAVRGTKRSLAGALAVDLETQLDAEAREQALCYESLDLAEGLAAVRARRPPRFSGR
jgi:enoyl-CoA hydratase